MPEGLNAKMETYGNCALLNVFARFYTTFERKFTEIARFFAVFDRVKKKSSGLSVHKSLFLGGSAVVPSTSLGMVKDQK